MAKTIRTAARSTMCDGKRHPHQRRLPAHVLNATGRRLERAMTVLRRCRSFAALHEIIREEIGPIYGIGPLAVYDVATRIGARLRLEPELVYLHAGTSNGARALGFDGGDPLKPKALPREFWILKPREMEDCLCIYADKLSRLPPNPAVHRTGARVARSGR